MTADLTLTWELCFLPDNTQNGIDGKLKRATYFGILTAIRHIVRQKKENRFLHSSLITIKPTCL